MTSVILFTSICIYFCNCLEPWSEYQAQLEMFLLDLLQTKTLMGDVMKEASFSLAEAKFAMGDFNHLVLQNVNKAQIKVRSKKDNVAGRN